MPWAQNDKVKVRLVFQTSITNSSIILLAKLLILFVQLILGPKKRKQIFDKPGIEVTVNFWSENKTEINSCCIFNAPF
jgi:hypothetical protein